MNPEILGFIAGATTAIALLPQIMKSWKTKSTKDISYMWTFIFLVGLILWVTYGVLINSLPMIIMTSIEGLMTASLILLKFLYEK